MSALAERAECLVIAGVQNLQYPDVNRTRPTLSVSHDQDTSCCVVDHAIASIHRSLPLAAALQGCIQRLLQAYCRALDLTRPSPTVSRGKRFSKYEAARRKNLGNKVPICNYGVLLSSVF